MRTCPPCGAGTESKYSSVCAAAGSDTANVAAITTVASDLLIFLLLVGTNLRGCTKEWTCSRGVFLSLSIIDFEKQNQWTWSPGGGSISFSRLSWANCCISIWVLLQPGPSASGIQRARR